MLPAGTMPKMPRAHGAGAAHGGDLVPPAEQPEKWDAADAVAEKAYDCTAMIAHAERRVVKDTAVTTDLHARCAARRRFAAARSLISPRVVTPGGMLVFGGAPASARATF